MPESMPDSFPLTEVGGEFVKIAFESEVDLLLQKGHPDRPAARFNRPGQDALYLSPDEKSARVAIGQYVTADDPPRVLVRYQVEASRLCDLRLEAAADIYALARQKWLPDVADSKEAASWIAADRIRQAGLSGLIDPSRRQPGLWHITLFRWNEKDGPCIQQIGDPSPILLKSESP